MQRFISAILLAAILLVPSAVLAEDEKSAVLVVSFGTSLPEARHAIDNLADSARKEFPKCEVRLAFTSNIIRRKIARESEELIPNPVQALAQLNDKGFSRVYVMFKRMLPSD